jgi:hypothetical protein
MSIRWWEYKEWTPPFSKRVSEEMANFLSHEWEKRYITSNPKATFVPFYTACKNCTAVTSDESQKYPCGAIPPKVSYSEYASRMKQLGRGSELPK